MRTWGRRLVPYPPSGQVSSTQLVDGPPKNYEWFEIDTDAGGSNDYVYITTLIQTLRLNLGESPFYANFGIPAKTMVIQQTQPDFYVQQTQAYYAQFFASLIIAKQPQSPNDTAPVYNISIIRKNGTKFQTTVGI